MIKYLIPLAILLGIGSAWAQTPGMNGSNAAQPVGGTADGAIPYHLLSTASTNSNSVKGAPGNVYQVIAINTTTTLYYLKFYDTAAAPTCNSSTVVQTYPVPFGTSNAGGGFTIPVPVGMNFLNGIGICLTGGIADNDNSNAATGVAINILYR